MLSKILVVLFGLMLVLPSFSARACGGHASKSQHHHKNQVAKNQAPSSSHEKNCTCPLHFMGCCQGAAYVQKEIPSFTFELKVDPNFYSYKVSIRQEPVLEGPFQPPRA